LKHASDEDDGVGVGEEDEEEEEEEEEEEALLLLWPFMMLAAMRSARLEFNLGASMRERARVEWVDVSDDDSDDEVADVRALHSAE